MESVEVENLATAAAAVVSEICSGDIPVDDIPKCGNVVGATVLVVEVVGVFPDVEPENRCAGAGASNFTHEWVVLIGGGANAECAVFFFAEPCPAGSESGGCGFGKGFFHAVKRTEVALDGGGEVAGRGGCATRRDDFPEKAVVEVSATVVAHRSEDVCGDFIEVFDEGFYRKALKVLVFIDRSVEAGDVGGVVLRVVDLHGASIDVWCQGVVGVTKFR